MGFEIYPEIILEGDLSPESFGDEVDGVCEEIHGACKGFGTDEDRLLQTMGSLSADQRCKVMPRYKELYDRDLEEDMKSECGRRAFGFALQLLSLEPVRADCKLIVNCCEKKGSNKFLLCTILCGRSNREMTLLKQKWFDLKDHDLVKPVDEELNGDLEKLAINVMQGAEEEFDPDYHNDEKLAADVEELHAKGIGRWGTDEKGLFKMLCAAPDEYLKMLNDAYNEKYGFPLTKALEKELGGVVRDATLFLVGMKLDPYKEVAKVVDRACRGFGTDELLLTATLIRYQPILKQVKEAHLELYSKTIEERVKSETGGDYEKLLLAILATAD